MSVVALTSDLVFASKISETASQLQVEARIARTPAQVLAAARELPAATIVLDLGAPADAAFDVLRELRAVPEFAARHTIGFLSHVRVDLAQRAREAGCERVMARSEFTSQLPHLLRQS